MFLTSAMTISRHVAVKPATAASSIQHIDAAMKSTTLWEHRPKLDMTTTRSSQQQLLQLATHPNSKTPPSQHHGLMDATELSFPPPQRQHAGMSPKAISMTTYSAFDPGASRPPFLLSGLSFLVANTQDQAKTEQSNANTTTTLAVPARPWPYSLPKRLQPKKGTTYQAKYSTASSVPVEEVAGMEKPVRVLQAILYGVLDPDGYSYFKEAAQVKWLKNVLFGMKKADEEEGALKWED